mgnify:CR=1 FL=1
MVAHTPMDVWHRRAPDYPHRVATGHGVVLPNVAGAKWPLLYVRDRDAGVDRWGFKTAEAAQAFMRTYGGRLDG